MNVFYDANALYDAGTRAMAGSKWKYKTQMYEQNHLLETAHLQKALMEGTYKPEPTHHFTIKERGKARNIASASAADKTINHLLCDAIYTPTIARYLQYDNSASQKGKGVDFHRRRLEAHLHQYYMREHTNEGYILLIDFSKYYANIPHDKCLAMLDSYAAKVADGDTLELVKAITRSAFSTFGGEKGVDIGNQLSQDIGIMFPRAIDDYIKIVMGVKLYGRYTDDTYVIHRDKAFLYRLLDGIRAIASTLGIIINERKTHIGRLSRGFRHLQIFYTLTDTGRLIRKINPKSITRERRKLKAYKRQLDKDKLSIGDIENCFKSWICGHWHYMSRQQIGNMSRLYQSLFERRITWKRHGRLRYLMAQ